MSTNLTLTARELELLKEVGKHLQTASVSQLPLPAPSLPLIHLSLNKAPLRLSQQLPPTHSLTHSLARKNRSTGPPSLKTSTTKLPKPLAINGILFVINFLEELRRAPTAAPAAATRRVVEVGRILLRRLFVRRRGNLVSFFFFRKEREKDMDIVDM